MVVDVGAREAYRQWRMGGIVDWNLLELRGEAGKDPVRVEAVCRDAGALDEEDR
jgi:hypothetical protein